MRHLQTTKRLNRPLGARKALIRNLLIQLYTHESLTTTQAKAKLIKPLADKLINRAKTNNVHTQRLISSTLNDASAVKKLFHQIAPRYQQPSGFTRIIKIGRRAGDNALIAKISLINATQPKTNNQPAKSQQNKKSNKQQIKKSNTKRKSTKTEVQTKTSSKTKNANKKTAAKSKSTNK